MNECAVFSLKSNIQFCKKNTEIPVPFISTAIEYYNIMRQERKSTGIVYCRYDVQCVYSIPLTLHPVWSHSSRYGHSVQPMNGFSSIGFGGNLS